MARRCNVPNAMSLTIREIDMRLKVCVAQWDYFRKHVKAYQQKHLFQRLDAAKEKEDNKAAKQILAIIQREKDRSFGINSIMLWGSQEEGLVSRSRSTKVMETCKSTRRRSNCRRQYMEQYPPKALLPCRGGTALLETTTRILWVQHSLPDC